MRVRPLPTALLALALAASAAQTAEASPDKLRDHLVASYDFEHPARGNPAVERDQGRSGTDITLVNGGGAMRVRDRAYRHSRTSIQLGQRNTGPNDDWKAGVYGTPGVPSLRAFNAARGVTLMGWFKMTGQNPSPNTGTANPDDLYDAIGLAGLLTGAWQGHNVRALLEVWAVKGELRLVALGRRLDGGQSQTLAASEDWRTLLPQNTWVFLSATFDFETGAMALYKDGRPIPGFYAVAGDPWELTTTPAPHTTSATDPRGIKIGGSFPQNTQERNPCACRMDGLMFYDRVATPKEVLQQYRRMR